MILKHFFAPITQHSLGIPFAYYIKYKEAIMTDINQINESTKSFSASSPKVSKNEKIDAFENALNKAFDKTGATKKGPASPNALTEIASKDLNIDNFSDIVTGKTDKLLEMLDLYSSKLEDPNVSLKSIALVLEEINQSAGNLLKDSQALSSEDETLKQIATQTIVTAQTEYMKFQRGDYLA